MRTPCGCCEGLESLTPLFMANRPGLDALMYRVGTHATFLETMKARLSNGHFPALASLKTRNENDPSIALLDAWATIADILTFYQERIAHEGYLRTATERRSVLELARLVGYTLRPGVAATVYPAFTMEIDYNEDSEIPAGTRIQSLPDSGEMPQFFETAEKIAARTDWNNLKPRMTQPQCLTLSNAKIINTLYFQGISTGLRPNDPLLLVFGSKEQQQALRWAKTVEPQAAENRTKVTLQKELSPLQASVFDEIDIDKTFEKYLAQESFCISLEADMLKQLQNILDKLNKDQQSSGTLKDDTKTDLQTYLLKLLKQRNLAVKNGQTRLAAWLGGLTDDLQAIADSNAIEIPPLPVVKSEGGLAFTQLEGVLNPLLKSASLQPANALRLGLTANQALAPKTDIAPRILTTLKPVLRSFLYQAWQNLDVTEAAQVEVYALRVHASVFGHNAPPRPIIRRDGVITAYLEWDTRKPFPPQNPDNGYEKTEDANVVWLDASYEQILPGSWVVLERPQLLDSIPKTVITQAREVSNLSRSEYGISAKSSRIQLQSAWIHPNPNPSGSDQTRDGFQVIRETAVYTQSEKLQLAEEPVETQVGFNPNDPAQGKRIELNALYPDLEVGRWLIVSGDRADVSGVKSSELVMVSGVEQTFDPLLVGEKTHTTLVLANSLAYPYKRNTVTIYGNVVKATHGETRTEVLGSGDGSQVFQSFPLRQLPLTYLAAPTPVGAASTLEVRVNEIRWHETNSLVDLKPSDRAYSIKIDDNGNTLIIFGNGQAGTRLPTGFENVKAIYRSGIGQAGNVKAEQISQLANRPRGLKSVINPLPATGGADRESRDQARRNTPLAVMSLDRLVSVQDYADFAQTYAGIGKASAMRLSNGRQQVVHLTIAGANDIPIDKNSDLYRNLYQALRQFGDPFQPIQLEQRELLLLIISAQIKLSPDYLWESVAPQIRQTLLDYFSFEQRELGQDVTQSEVIRTIQQVTGVTYVDLDILDTVSETEAANLTDLAAKLKQLAQTGSSSDQAQPKQPKTRVTVNLARVESDPLRRFLPDKQIQPAQLAVLSPTVPLTLVLNPVEVQP